MHTDILKFRSHAYSAKLPYLHGCAHALLRVVITRRRGRLRLGLVLIILCLAALIAYLGIVVELDPPPISRAYVPLCSTSGVLLPSGPWM